MQCCTLFCKTRPPVSFVMSKFQKQNLVKVPFHFVSQQKTRSSTVVFDVASAVRPIQNNTFEINWYTALSPNPIGITAKTSLPWHTILWIHSICSTLKALWTKLSGEPFKSDIMMEFISSGDVTLPHRKPINGLVLSTFCLLTNQIKVQILD